MKMSDRCYTEYFCGSFSLKSSSLAMAAMNMVLCSLYICIYIIEMLSEKHIIPLILDTPIVNLEYSLLAGLIGLFSWIWMYGVLKRKPNYLLPMLIFTSFAVIVLFLLPFFILFHFSETPAMSATAYVPILFLVSVFFAAFVVHVWTIQYGLYISYKDDPLQMPRQRRRKNSKKLQSDETIRAPASIRTDK